MKLSKMLLGAILAGVAVTSVISCSKKDHEVRIQTDVDNRGGTDVLPGDDGKPPYDCPGCGMG